ncbi:ABC transporter permease subunit [Rhizobium sp. AG855]|uniref:ABC transporter permease n=1 Tax=Rhizobium sp. AG855 TaxID=2183898 RepID=UPI000E74C4BF|nr:ABC transporter permease subunit [Rhizobium sp. AG855]RKE83370.1 glycine betaine/proline transport system permease protein [Rhizobium sp. AG855]
MDRREFRDLVVMAALMAGSEGTAASAAGALRVNGTKVLLWAALAVVLVGYFARGALPESLYVWPDAYRIPLQATANEWLDQLLRRTVIFDQPLRMWTRSFGEVLGVPMRFIQSALANGWNYTDASGARATIPPMPWLVVTAFFAAAAWLAAGYRLAIFTLATFAYFAVFGLWNEAMLTLASVSVTIALGVVIGLLAGIALWRWPRLEAVLNPIFDIMQTIPPFSYLVPVLVLFGFGPVAALVATMIFALPPMAKATAYALRRVPVSVMELADMTGANFWQQQRKILISTARTDILLGLNQLVMMSLAMVILASMIGAGGLGGEVLKALQSLRFGRGLEAGIAITLMAIHLYSFGHAIATRRPSHQDGQEKRKRTIVFGSVVLLAVVLALLVPAFRQFPAAWTVSSSDIWSKAIVWLNGHWGWFFEAFRATTTFWILRPLLGVMQGIGWFPAALGIGLLCLALGRPQIALLSVVIILAISAIGYWEPAIITLHLVFAGTLLSLLVGVPVGMWASSSRRVYKFTDAIVTTLQTLPSFVYLIPIVMLLGPGDVSGVLAIAIYSMATTIRYVSHALKEVDKGVLEAADMFGASYWQTFMKVRLPLAWPGLLLALNQTLMMAVGMVVITSLIGTRGLELETIEAIAKVQAGRSLVAGLAICALAILIDRIMNAAAESCSPEKSRKAKVA